MTPTKFIFAIEKYYGSYSNDFILKIVKEYIEQNYAESQLDEILKTIIAKYTNKFKTPPDVAEIRNLVENIDSTAEQEWIKLFNKSGADDVIITDIVLYNTVATWGSWDNFCIQRDGQYREVTHKNFITKYIMMSQSLSLVQPEILKGASTILYGEITSCGGLKQVRVPIVIGCEIEAKQMLSNNKALPVIGNFLDKIKLDK